MTSKGLLASAGTVEGVEKLINGYFYSTAWRVNPETLEVWNEKLGKTLDGFRVVKKGRRYRFELFQD